VPLSASFSPYLLCLAISWAGEELAAMALQECKLSQPQVVQSLCNATPIKKKQYAYITFAAAHITSSAVFS
jgi:hypothetical protein